MTARKNVLPIAVIDAETDPGKHGRTPKPFAWGWFDGAYYRQFWGHDCTEQLLKFLKAQKPHQIFAHNGGRFDFAFFNQLLSGKPLIVGSRIVDATLFQHIISDSYARIPVALARFGEKQEIDYRLFEAHLRDTPSVRPKIEAYLEQDCRLLYKVIFNWLEKYGRQNRTMASAAFKECEKAMAGQPGLRSRMRPNQDATMRQFYYGGRVQAFEKGVVLRDLTMWDVNSMYPYGMVHFEHPLSADPLDWIEGEKEVDERTDFAIIDAWSKGALPMRLAEGHLHFPSCYGRFYATGHEIREGVALGRLKIDRVIYTYRCKVKGNFRRFIEPLYAERMCYKLAKNTMGVEFSKLEMNGVYGKYAINPRKFREWIFVPPSELGDHEIGMATDEHGKQRLCLRDEKGLLYTCDQLPGPNREALRFYRSSYDPSKRSGFRNVATAASITGACRAVLLRGLHLAEKPAYCDTDAICAQKLEGVEFDEYKLGAWKFEASGNEMLIGGKKLYAMLGERPSDDNKALARVAKFGEPWLLEPDRLPKDDPRLMDLEKRIDEAARCVKLASKGGRLYVSDLRRVAMGETVAFYGDMPVFDKYGMCQFDKATNGEAKPKLFRMTNTHLVTPFPDPITRWDLKGALQKVAPVGGW